MLSMLDTYYMRIHDLVMNIAGEMGMSAHAKRIVDRVFYSELDSLDTKEDLTLIIKAQEIYRLLDLLAQKSIAVVEPAWLKSALWESLKADRQITRRIALSKERIDALQASLSPTVPAGDLEEIGRRLSIVGGLMDKITEMEENLTQAVNESKHKVFYDYIATLMTPHGVPAIKDKQFLEAELLRIRQLKATVTRPVLIDRTLGEMANVRTELKEAALLPPGIVRSMPVGMRGADVLRILQRAERVGSYFLEQMGSQGVPEQKA